MIRNVTAVLCGVLFLAVGATARGGDAGQDELLRKIEVLEQQLQELKAQKQASLEKKRDCLAAVGAEKFCACLTEKLPREMGFEAYVHAVVTPREKLGYDGLTPEQKRQVDAATAARDACAAKAGSGFFW